MAKRVADLAHPKISAWRPLWWRVIFKNFFLLFHFDIEVFTVWIFTTPVPRALLWSGKDAHKPRSVRIVTDAWSIRNVVRQPIVEPAISPIYDHQLLLTSETVEYITGPPLMGQYCFARWRLSSSSVGVVCRLSGSVTLPAGGPAGRWERGRSARRPPGALAVGRPTIHDGPVRLRPVRATPCFVY